MKKSTLTGLTPKDILLLSSLAIDAANKGELSPEMIKKLTETTLKLNESRLGKGKEGNNTSKG